MSTHTDFRGVYYPYCLDRQEDGRWTVLNRHYKPVGQTSEAHAHYPDHATPLKISKVLAKKLQYNGEPKADRIYLYNDGCVPTHSKKHMDAYLEKLRLLAKLQIVL